MLPLFHSSLWRRLWLYYHRSRILSFSIPLLRSTSPFLQLPLFLSCTFVQFPYFIITFNYLIISLLHMRVFIPARMSALIKATCSGEELIVVTWTWIQARPFKSKAKVVVGFFCHICIFIISATNITITAEWQISCLEKQSVSILILNFPWLMKEAVILSDIFQKALFVCLFFVV